MTTGLDINPDDEAGGLSPFRFLLSERTMLNPSQSEPAVMTPANQVPMASTMLQSTDASLAGGSWHPLG
jgi:hypothetical protein